MAAVLKYDAKGKIVPVIGPDYIYLLFIIGCCCIGKRRILAQIARSLLFTTDTIFTIAQPRL